MVAEADDSPASVEEEGTESREDGDLPDAAAGRSLDSAVPSSDFSAAGGAVDDAVEAAAVLSSAASSGLGGAAEKPPKEKLTAGLSSFFSSDPKEKLTAGFTAAFSSEEEEEAAEGAREPKEKLTLGLLAAPEEEEETPKPPKPVNADEPAPVLGGEGKGRKRRCLKRFQPSSLLRHNLLSPLFIIYLLSNLLSPSFVIDIYRHRF